MTATDFEQDLRVRLQRLADHAPPPPTGPDGRRPSAAPARRRAVPALAATAVVVALVGGAVALARAGRDDSPTTPAVVPWRGVGDEWTALAPGPADGRVFPVVLWTDHGLFVWGGETASEQAWSDTGAIYDPGPEAWREIAASPLSPRSEHVAVWTGTEVIVCCGRAPDGDAAAAAAYDPGTDTWRELAAPPFEAEFAAAVWTGDRMVVTGGATDGGVTAVRTTYAYDPDADAWERRADLPTEVGIEADAAWTGDQLVLWPRAGTSAPPLSYDPAADRWSELPRVPNERHPQGGSMVWTGDDIVVWGPATSPIERVVPAVVRPDRSARLDPDEDAWRTIADDRLGEAIDREGLEQSTSAVWTGREVVVWSAPEDPTAVDRAATQAYDPGTDTWRRLPDAPALAHHPPIVWTGDVVVVATAEGFLALRP
jgi:hypothetical protein